MRHSYLPEALAVFIKRGMVKGQYMADSGQVCMRAALNTSANGNTLGPRSAESAFKTWCADLVLLNEVARELFPDRIHPSKGGIAYFNDHPDTTFKDAIQVFEKAIVRWQEEI